MTDFAGQIGALVQVARTSANTQREAERRQVEADALRLKQSRDRAVELVGSIWELVKVAGQASDGAIAIDRNRNTTTTTFKISWQEGQPDRALFIHVDETDGMIQAAWVVPPGYGRSVDAPNVPVTDFEIANVEAAILLLADQRRWARGAIPMITW
jgi:hypothetical protein